MRFPKVCHLNLPDYVTWTSDEAVGRVTQEAGWWPPQPGEDDWHSDCHFHAIKDYMFQRMFGAMYMDAFLSNQVRHGILDRDQALC